MDAIEFYLAEKSVFFREMKRDELMSLNSFSRDWLTPLRLKCAICADVMKYYLPSLALNGVIKWSECIFPNTSVQFNRTTIMLNVLCTHSRISLAQCFKKLKFSADFLSEQSNNFSDVVCACARNIQLFLSGIQTIWMGYLSGSFFFYGVSYTLF